MLELVSYNEYNKISARSINYWGDDFYGVGLQNLEKRRDKFIWIRQAGGNGLFTSFGLRRDIYGSGSQNQGKIPRRMEDAQ